MAIFISTVLIPCLKSFNQLQEQVEQADYSHQGEVSSTSWGDELGRLRIWAANIGAHQKGQSSLDFRLRDASHISKQIIKLLQDLEQSLHDILDELSQDDTGASEDDDISAIWPGDKSTTELQQLYSEVVNIIDCLYQLSMLIRKPAQHDMLIGSRISDKAEFEFYDKEHVRNMYPKIEEQLGQRLGHAITRRRKYLFYRERHHRKLEEGIEEAQGIERTATGSVMSETVATDFKTQNIDFVETSSDSGLSQTSYAPSLMDGGRITIPPLPKESMDGKPFQCPYCFFVIEVKTTRSWNRHIFKDIKPYLCTFPRCSMSDSLYDSRREWHLHERTEHYCEDLICHLCKDRLTSSKQYERHVGRHLEELALFALPRLETDDAEDDGDDDVVDVRDSTIIDGVTKMSDHSEHSSLASVTDDEDSADTHIQVGPRSELDVPVASSAQHGSMQPEQNPVPHSQNFTSNVTTQDLNESSSAMPLELTREAVSDVIGRPETAGQTNFETSNRIRANIPPGHDVIDLDHTGDPIITAGYEHEYEYEKRMIALEELEEREEETTDEEVTDYSELRRLRRKTRQILREKAIEEYNTEQAERKAKERMITRETDKKFSERMKKTLRQGGFTEEKIEEILKKRGPVIYKDLLEPQYTKVHRKHMSRQILDEHEIPWELDEVNFPLLLSYIRFEITNDVSYQNDSNYIIIKGSISEFSEDLQDILFAQTKRLRDSGTPATP